METTAAMRQLIDELTNALEAEKEANKKYLEQLLDTRDRLVRQDYQVENSKRDIENFNKVLRKYEKENQVLKDLVKAQSMAHLEFL